MNTLTVLDRAAATLVLLALPPTSKNTVPGVRTPPAALTVPVRVTSCSLAPVLVSVILPLMGPWAAPLVMRTLMVVLATVPEAGVKVTVVL